MLIPALILVAALALMPLGDDNEGRATTPYVTYALIALNIAVFFLLQLPSDAFTYGYSVIPKEITSGHDFRTPIIGPRGQLIPEAPGPTPIYLTLLTSMFMHGGYMHLFGNMLYLWIFGDNVEDAMGHAKFLAFYLICGITAAIAQIMTGPNSLIPSLGASGAIAGVLGAYIFMFPSRQVRVLIGYMGIVPMPAILVIGFWAVLQFMNGLGSIARTDQTDGGGVAYIAHVGGFLAGLILVSLFRNPETKQRVQQRVNYPTGRSYYGGPPYGY